MGAPPVPLGDGRKGSAPRLLRERPSDPGARQAHSEDAEARRNYTGSRTS